MWASQLRSRAAVAAAARRGLHSTPRRWVIRPVGEFGADTGSPGPDPAGQAALKRFVEGAPANFITDLTYRVAAFSKADKDGSKTVDIDELKAIMNELCPWAHKDAAELLKAADTNGDGVLQLNEFLKLFEQHKK